MPFCTQCGNQVQPADTFCAKCGTRQAVGAKAANTGDVLKNMSSRTASMLCYIPVVGWIAAVIVLASPRFRQERDVRFHAFQGLYLFVVWLMVDWVFQPIFHAMPGPNPMRAMVGLMHVVVFGAWIWMIIKTAQEQMFRLPIVGDLAERSVAEQR
jgi:uncharacterized membrane protein